MREPIGHDNPRTRRGASFARNPAWAACTNSFNMYHSDEPVCDWGFRCAS